MSGAPLDQFFTPQVFLKSIPLLVLAGLGYLLFALAINVRCVSTCCAISGSGCWPRPPSTTSRRRRNVSARGELANALGEGFADGWMSPAFSA